MSKHRRAELEALTQRWIERFGQPPVALASPKLMREILATSPPNPPNRRGG